MSGETCISDSAGLAALGVDPAQHQGVLDGRAFVGH
jgi:hypothetical protein